MNTNEERAGEPGLKVRRPAKFDGKGRKFRRVEKIGKNEERDRREREMENETGSVD